MSRMNPGELKHRISVQKFAKIEDGGGGFTEEWIDLFDPPEIWASINPLSGRELFVAMQIQSMVSHKIKIRYRSGITNKHRVEYKGRVYNILAVIDKQERHKELELMCEEEFNTDV